MRIKKGDKVVVIAGREKGKEGTVAKVLPKEEKDAYSEEARTYYVYISTIRQDVVYANNKLDIDFSFLEALASEELDYYDRMKYINKYSEKEWKNVTNSSERPKAVKTLGFN